MHTSNSQSAPLKQSITVKKHYTLSRYIDILFIIRNYYDAMRLGTQQPSQPLPSLSDMLDAYTICMAYAEAKPLPSINLVKALMRLDADKIVAIWLFNQRPNCNITIGNKQIVVLNTSKA
jgi:hypothetical protein